MGIDISGKMIVGAYAKNFDFSEKYEQDEDFEVDERYEEQEFDYCSPWFDAGGEEWFVGYEVEDVDMVDFDEWVKKVKELSTKFEEKTGIKPRLVGMQNVF